MRQAAPTASKRQRRECFHIHLAGWHGLQSTTTTGRLGGRNGAEMLRVIEVKWHETFGMVEYVDLKVAKAASCGYKLVDVWQMRLRLLTLPSDTFVMCVSVVLLQIRFCVLDHEMILVGLSQRLRNHGPDLHTSEADHGETFTTVDNFSSDFV